VRPLDGRRRERDRKNLKKRGGWIPRKEEERERGKGATSRESPPL